MKKALLLMMVVMTAMLMFGCETVNPTDLQVPAEVQDEIGDRFLSPILGADVVLYRPFTSFDEDSAVVYLPGDKALVWTDALEPTEYDTEGGFLLVKNGVVTVVHAGFYLSVGGVQFLAALDINTGVAQFYTCPVNANMGMLTGDDWLVGDGAIINFGEDMQMTTNFLPETVPYTFDVATWIGVIDWPNGTVVSHVVPIDVVPGMQILFTQRTTAPFETMLASR